MPHPARSALALVALLLAAPCTLAPGANAGPAGASTEAGSLRIGATAPAVVASKWIKGEPVTSFENGKVYVVEFWATWCAPCIAAMPHLRDVQEKHRADGLRVVSVTAGDPANTLEKVERFVTRKGDGMNYAVAFDEGKTTYDAYLKGTARSGVPATFIVDRQGRLAWVGLPKDMDAPLASVLAGTWDLEKAAKEFDAKLARDILSAKWYDGVNAKDAASIEPLLPEVLASYHDDVEALTSHCWAVLSNSTDLRLTEHPKLLAGVTAGIERANALRPAPHAYTLNALARARFLNGNRDEAVALVKQALVVGADEGDYLTGYLKQFLAEYEAAPPR